MPRKPCNETGPLPDLLSMGQSAVCAALDGFGSATPEAPLVAVDATCGNGHDTRFLLKALAARFADAACGLFSFDVQQAALDAARGVLVDCPAPWLERVFFLLRSHAELGAALEERQRAYFPSEARPRLAIVMYNLGFLPRSDKQVTTQAASTLASLEQAAASLASGGLISIHAYGGHPGGREELEAVAAWCAELPCDEWTVVRYAVCNKTRNPESLFLAWKLASRAF